MIPALKSGESKARKMGDLAVIARAVAKSAGLRFVRDAVRKEPHPPIHTTRSAVERSEMLDQAGYESSAIDADTILVFDDFITRGSTLSHIAQAILRENPRVRVYGLALCKTEGRGFNKDRFGVELSNDHVPGEWRTLWDRGKKQ